MTDKDMGVKGLWKLIQEKAPKSIRAVKSSDLRGEVIALDASFVITQFRTAIKEPLAHDHLHAIISKTVALLRQGITPVYVFDGVQPEVKKIVCADRRPAPVPTRAEVAECKDLLNDLGIAWVASPGEADVVCAAMTGRGEAYAVLSEDLDMFAHGARRVLRTWTHRGGVCVETAAMLAEIGLTPAQFVDLCLLLGTDYAATVRGIGPKRAWESIAAGKKPEDLETSPRWEHARGLFGPPVEYTIVRPAPRPESWPGHWARLALREERRHDIAKILCAHHDLPNAATVQIM